MSSVLKKADKLYLSLSLSLSQNSHDDIVTWQFFQHNWPLVKETTGHRWISLTMGQ